jgi:hypothetical protein
MSVGAYAQVFGLEKQAAHFPRPYVCALAFLSLAHFERTFRFTIGSARHAHCNVDQSTTWTKGACLGEFPVQHAGLLRHFRALRTQQFLYNVNSTLTTGSLEKAPFGDGHHTDYCSWIADFDDRIVLPTQKDAADRGHAKAIYAGKVMVARGERAVCGLQFASETPDSSVFLVGSSPLNKAKRAAG